MSNDSTQLVTPPSGPIVLPTSPTSAFLIYHALNGKEIDDALLERCAKLFSDSYGIWGQSPTTIKGPKPGFASSVHCVAVPDSTVLVVCYKRDQDHQDPNHLELVGHVFATAWDYEGGRVGWVTQLVVSVTERRRYIATSLLQMLKLSPVFRGITAIGLASSHPSACHVLSKYTGLSILSVDMNFCQQNAKSILEGSPVDYVKNMELHGSLFDYKCTSGAVSSVNTTFYIDHNEPLAALAAYKARGQWLLGELLDGHEFLIILPA